MVGIAGPEGDHEPHASLSLHIFAYPVLTGPIRPTEQPC